MTDVIPLQGKVKWCHFTVPDSYEKWGCKLYPNDEGINKIRDLQMGTPGIQGIKNQLKTDEDGVYLQISRKTNMLAKGKVLGMAPPLVLMPDGKPLTETLVGNGSDCTLYVEVYQHSTPGGGKARALRLKSVRVDNLIPFEVARDFTPEEQDTVAEQNTVPKQLWD